MTKFRIHGRGGQGGVTLAKILAFIYWTEGKHVQAFGSYSAERTGAPVLAFTLMDDQEITNRNMVYYPDHLIILDPTLVKENIFSGLQPGGALLIDTPLPPEHFNNFSGYRFATIDAKKIARKYKLGTKTTPITNTALAGAFAKLFNLNFASVEKTIKALHFPEINMEAAKEAFIEVRSGNIVPGRAKIVPVLEATTQVPPLITGNLGVEPKLNVADWKSQEPFYSDENISPCNFNCPAGNNVRGFIEELMQGNYDKALEILSETSPLPGSTSRVCPHPCEDFCNRRSIDSVVNVHALERLAADRGKRKLVAPKDKFKERIAIIGSGPAGLSAAYHLQRLGYQVIIFEALSEPGGMLRSGIPEYRLPKDVLESEIKFITDSGVKIKCSSSIKSREDFQKLINEFDALLIAVGLSFGRGLNIENENSNVIQGVDFLHKINFGEQLDIGPKVLVIGGGNTAIDASRTAVRLGAEEVTIIYRRSREEMPAIKEEIAAATDEGVKLKFLYSPIKIAQTDGRKFLQLQRMQLGTPDPSGRRSPIPVEGKFEKIEFSTIIAATGQIAELDFADSIETENGFIKTDRFGATSSRKIFAAGDVVTNDGTVTHAIGDGRKAALTIHASLRNLQLPELKPNKEKVTTEEEMKLYYFDPVPRNEVPELDVTERVNGFSEVNLGIDDIKEAWRCMSCGICNGCLGTEPSKCELFCPERTIKRVSATKLNIHYNGCKGCLICMDVCPRGAMDRRTVVRGNATQ